MNLSFGIKIRFLLLILGCCLIITSISLNQFTTKADLLEIDAQKVQKNLNKIEQLVENIISNNQEIAKLKKYHTNPYLALDFINTYRTEGVNLLSYQGNELKYWSTFKVSDINPQTIKEGSSVLFFYNGWYEVIKKTKDDFIFIFLIDIQSQYPIKENQFFKNDINPLLSDSKALTLSSFSDKDIYVIKSLDNKFLFGLKFKNDAVYSYHHTLQVWLFIAGILSICFFFNSLCSFIAKKGYVNWATLLLFAFFALARITDLHYGWFNHRFNLDIFDPRIYSESTWMPSLGDFLLNILAITWFLLFVYSHRNQYQFSKAIKQSKIAGVFIYIVLISFIGYYAIFSDNQFLGLILNSKINFDIVNILKLGGTSWVSIVILCLVWFQIFLITAISVTLSKQLNLSSKNRLIIFICAFSIFFIYKLIVGFTLFFVIYAILIFVVARRLYLDNTKFTIPVLALIFFCIAFNTSIKYIKYKDIKERIYRETLAQKFQSTDDPNAVVSLGTLERQLLEDKFLVQYFEERDKKGYTSLKNHIKDYMDGYLSRYNYKIFEYNKNEEAITPNSDLIEKYKNLVQSGSVKIEASNFFYKVNNTFGYQDYFGILPVISSNELIGTLIIELRSKPFNYNNRLPDLLSDNRFDENQELNKYSIALYSNNKLLNQSGNYTYPISSSSFNGQLNSFTSVNDSKLAYNHLIYKPTESKTIVISKEKVDYLERLAALSFFFLVFIIFSIILFALVWLVKNLDDDRVGWFNINRSLMINANKILYKTRIQFSIVLSVVATLLIVGWITYFYMDRDYINQQNIEIKDKIRKIQQNYEKQIFNKSEINPNQSDLADFNNFADLNNADLNLYDTDGDLLMTTYPKLFNYKIIGKKMGPKAFIYLSTLNRSEYINSNEKIGTLTYAAAYAPIRNSQNKTIAYISLPNYSNQAEYQDKIGLFLSNLINIYALVFVAIGVLAVFLANQITSPLTFIQENISRTKMGQRSEPIVWRRHDEIGTLIKEYNSMIEALEQSAIKLARSERENAWREMAKQVAHEIKNPLTPLKLGVQLLEKSWKENDPNFELKFNKFSKSFIEQIDSLSKIASEFSDFAKMPDTRIEKFDVVPILEKTKEVFNTLEVEINILNNTNTESLITADKDQILRAFNNLFKNATEAETDAPKRIITVVVYNDDENVYLEVKDNGKGIPEHLQNKIFVPNFTTKSSGTGLGLAFVKQAVSNAGGKVSFNSISGQGTTFYLSFPLA